MAMADDESMYEYYADPENRVPSGPGRRRASKPLTTHVPIRFSPEVIAQVKQLADMDRKTVSSWIRDAVEVELSADDHASRAPSAARCQLRATGLPIQVSWPPNRQRFPMPSKSVPANPADRIAPRSCACCVHAGLSPKVVSERIGHANVGFFLETYAHVLKNDDRHAAEQAASFLIGAGWDPESDDKQD